jgi:hypothetical protein
MNFSGVLITKKFDLHSFNITCQYMQFGQSSCMFHISYGLQWRQGLRYAVALPVAESATHERKLWN